MYVAVTIALLTSVTFDALPIEYVHWDEIAHNINATSAAGIITRLLLASLVQCEMVSPGALILQTNRYAP